MIIRLTRGGSASSVLGEISSVARERSSPSLAFCVTQGGSPLLWRHSSIPRSKLHRHPRGPAPEQLRELPSPDVAELDWWFLNVSSLISPLTPLSLFILLASLSIRPACEQLLSPPSLGIVVWWILRRHVRHLSGAALPFTYVASPCYHLCAPTHILRFISALHGDTCNLIVLSIYFTEFLTAKSWT